LPEPPDTEPAAPILVVPRVLEPEFCTELRAHHEHNGGVDTGFMRTDERGRTVAVHDHAHKRRQDLTIEGPLRQGLRDRVERRPGVLVLAAARGDAGDGRTSLLHAAVPARRGGRTAPASNSPHIDRPRGSGRVRPWTTSPTSGGKSRPSRTRSAGPPAPRHRC